ncbi:harpin-induced like protein 20 [Zostera marina]|uniref:Harpin-induced like protein 20 n=1 Tax=Zostera marina TaxID=29655 RepID=A0A0K9PIG4_ZOSMR|nr:harpin-induced like protein 20 [Zostera marina]
MSKDKGDCERRRCLKQVCGCLFLFVFLVLLTILIIFLVLRPTKPKFYLKDATIYDLDLDSSDGFYLNTTIQVTLSSRNPNDRIGIYYDRLDVYAEYKSQQITLPTRVNRAYQGHNDVTVWSPFLYGRNVPVASDLCVTLVQDQTAGLVLIHIKVAGKLRWKVGTWTSNKYHIHVTCPAFMTVDSTSGHNHMLTYRFQQITGCTVDV